MSAFEQILFTAGQTGDQDEVAAVAGAAWAIETGSSAAPASKSETSIQALPPTID